MATFIIRYLRNLFDVNTTGAVPGDVLGTTDGINWTPQAGGGGGGAPTNADYLVGTANASLTNEIVVGPTPGGELGGTWASPTVPGAVILAPASSARNVIQPTAGGVIAAIVKAHAAQSVDLTQWQTSAAAVLAKIELGGSWTIQPSVLGATGAVLIDGGTLPQTSENDPRRALLNFKAVASETTPNSDFYGARIGSYRDGNFDHVTFGKYDWLLDTYETGGDSNPYLTVLYRRASDRKITASSTLGPDFISVITKDPNTEAAIKLGIFASTGLLMYDIDNFAIHDTLAGSVAEFAFRRAAGTWKFGVFTAAPAPVVQQAASSLAALWTGLKNYGWLTAGSTVPTVYEPGGTDVALADGGTGASLADPNADRIMFWDDSGGAVTWLTVGSGLAITGTTIDATASGAPSTATYITQTPDAGLSAEQALSALATGLVKNTTGTGVLSIGAAGTDYYAPGGTDVAVADGGTGASTAVAARTALQSHPYRQAGYKVGEYYTGECIPNQGGGGANPVGRCMFIPFIVDVTTTFDRIAIYISSNGSAGALQRMGIYNDNAGVPGTVLLDAGTIATDTGAGSRRAITISQQLTPGQYWLASTAQVAAAVVQRAIATGAMQWLSASFDSQCVFVDGITGALGNNPAVAVAGINPTVVALRALSSP